MSISAPPQRTGSLPIEGPALRVPERFRWRRLAAAALFTLAIFAVLYLLVANILLRTRLLRNIVSSSSSPFALSGNSTELSFDYRSAYSLIPGRVLLEDVAVRGRDHALEWRVTLDRADVNISLASLLHRTLLATRLRGSGLSIRARLRLDRADATPSTVAALPPIAGFADPPLSSGPAPLPLTDAEHELWMLDFRDVDVEHMREVWIHSVRSEGDTRVRGRWVFRPHRLLEVGPARVDANGVDFFYGSEPLARKVRGSFEAAVHPFTFDARRAVGRAILDQLSYDGRLRGSALVPAALHLLAARSDLGVQRGEAVFDARILLSHGKLTAGTHVRTETADAALELPGLTFEAPVHSELAVEGQLATVETQISDVRVSHLGTEQARVASIAATVTSRQLQLARLFEDATFTVDVSGAETRDVGVWWNQFGPSTPTLIVRSQLVSVGGHADGSFTELRGRAELTARDLALGQGGRVLTGQLAMNVNLQRGSWANRSFDLSDSKVAFRAVSVKGERSKVPVLVIPSLSAVAPRFVLAPSQVEGRVSIDVPRAELRNLARVHELLSLPASLRIEGGRAGARLRADIELDSGSIRGDAEVALRGVRARVGATRFFGDVAGTLRAHRTEQGTTDFSGSTLEIEHASTGQVVPHQDTWWGKLALRAATLRTQGEMRFSARPHLQAKDATPATVLVAQNTAVPAWAAHLFRMPVLSADAQLTIGPSSLQVRSFVAHGGGTSLRAEYTKRDGRQDGAVLMDLGWLGLGYDLADGATGLVLIGPERWYARKVATLRGATAAAELEAATTERLARYTAMTPALRKSEARELAARCSPDRRACDDDAIQSLLRAAASECEGDALRGMLYAPLVVGAAKQGADGATLDPLVVGSSAEALRIGGESALDNIPSIPAVVALDDPSAARGKVIAATGRISSIRREGSYSSGTLTTDAEPVYFVTPFALDVVPESIVRYRGVFVQWYAPEGSPQSQPQSLVLVGAFGLE